MDLKKKIISFLKDKKGDDENDFQEEEWLNDAGVVKLKHCTLGVRDPRVDREAIESIEAPFFEDTPLDAVQVQLASFTESPDQQLIVTMCACLKTQLQAVSRKISDLVLDNHATYSSELEQVTTLQSDLHAALHTCLASRSCLKSARDDFTSAGLRLLFNQRRRGLLTTLLSSLHTIKTLQRTDNKLKELLKEEDFPGAIHLSLEYEKAASTYKHYHCISELSRKLQDNSELVDEALDVALSRTCTSFNHRLYTRLQQAYRLLGKSQVAADQLHMHYISSVHVTSFNKVLWHIEESSGSSEGDAFQKKQFPELCACIKSDVYVACLEELCGVLWRLVCSYKLTTEWHAICDSEEGFFERASSPSKYNNNNNNNESTKIEKNDINNNHTKTSNNNSNNNSIKSNSNQIINNNNKNNNNNNNIQVSKDNNNYSLQQLDLTSIHYIRNKLEAGKSKLWTEIQLKVKTYLLAHDLSHFKYEEFMSVLDIINKLIKIGSEFCRSASEGLEEAVQRQSSSYFSAYHAGRLEEMRVFVENESWVLCPVKSAFQLTKLQEFRFLKHLRSVDKSAQESYFVTYASCGSPFGDPDDDPSSIQTSSELKVQNSSMKGHNHTNSHGYEEDDDNDDDDDDDDVEDGLKGDYVDEECRNGDDDDHGGDDDDDGFSWSLTKSVRRQATVISITSTPIITNCTLYICKLFGRYMNMMSSLNSISYDVIKSMTQLIDFYFHAVYESFSSEKDQETLKLSSKFKSVVERVRGASQPPPSLFPTHQPPHTHQPPPTHQPPHKNLDHHHHASSTPEGTQRRWCNKTTDPFNSLKNRVVATESLLFLGSQFKELEGMLYEAVPDKQRGLLDQYFLQTLSVVEEMRTPVYRAFVRQHLSTQETLTLITSVTWDIDDIMSQHSEYVDVLLKEVDRFKGSVVTFSSCFPLPQPVVDCLWVQVSLLCCETLVEGFSACRRCSNEGRALMMLDFQQFLLKFHKLTLLRPIPGQAFVEGYIKAFYLPEAELERWLSSCQEYSGRQLTSLVGCLGGLSRKGRQKLVSLVDQERPRKL